MRRFRISVLVLAAVLVAGLAGGVLADVPLLDVTPSQETFKGKGTDEMFPKELTLQYSGATAELYALGSGVRKKMVFKVYEAIAYAEKGADLGDDPYGAFIEGDFARRIVMYFLRDVGGDKIRGAWEDGFKKTLGEKDLAPALEADMKTFIAFFDDEGVEEGETIELTWLPGVGLHTAVDGDVMQLINNSTLASGLWAIWLGDKPISGGLKKDLVRFVNEAE